MDNSRHAPGGSPVTGGTGGIYWTNNGGATPFTRYSTVGPIGATTPNQGCRSLAFDAGDSSGQTWAAAFEALGRTRRQGGFARVAPAPVLVHYDPTRHWRDVTA